MKQTNILGRSLFYKVGRLAIDDTQYFRDNEIVDRRSSTGSSVVLSPVVPGPSNNIFTDIVPIPHAITNTTNTDASQTIIPNNTTDTVTSDALITPTPTNGSSAGKINANWWWVLAAAALAYKLSK